MTDRLLTREVAARVGLRVETIRRYRVRGTFPEPDGHTLGHPWWRQKTVEAWLRGRRIRKEHAVGANPTTGGNMTRDWYFVATQPCGYTTRRYFTSFPNAVRGAEKWITDPWKADEHVEVYGPDGFEKLVQDSAVRANPEEE